MTNFLTPTRHLGATITKLLKISPDVQVMSQVIYKFRQFFGESGTLSRNTLTSATIYLPNREQIGTFQRVASLKAVVCDADQQR